MASGFPRPFEKNKENRGALVAFAASPSMCFRLKKRADPRVIVGLAEWRRASFFVFLEGKVGVPGELGQMCPQRGDLADVSGCSSRLSIHVTRHVRRWHDESSCRVSDRPLLIFPCPRSCPLSHDAGFMSVGPGQRESRRPAASSERRRFSIVLRKSQIMRHLGRPKVGRPERLSVASILTKPPHAKLRQWASRTGDFRLPPISLPRSDARKGSGHP